MMLGSVSFESTSCGHLETGSRAPGLGGATSEGRPCDLVLMYVQALSDSVNRTLARLRLALGGPDMSASTNGAFRRPFVILRTLVTNPRRR